MAQKEPKERLVLCDASPLIGLAAAGGFGLLRRLFGVVHITTAVRDEVIAGVGKPGVTEVGKGLHAGWLRVVDNPKAATASTDLGEGEASTLHTARAAGPDTLVILDDKQAHDSAAAEGIEHIGTLGLLMLAKQRGLIKAARGYLIRLEAHGFHLPDALVRAVLRDLGEA